MMPNDPLQRALHRSWIQFCGSFFGDIFNLIGGKDEDAVENIEYDILEKLEQVEAIKSATLCFHGDELSLVDTAFAALFMRLDLLKAGRDLLDNKRFPKLNAWSQHLLGLDSVKNSVVPEFPQIYLGMVNMREGFISQNL